MIVNIDIKGLEIVCAAYLSGDAILKKELQDGADIHSNNQAAFNLPSRLIAKVLIFRILFGGTEHSFVRDPDFMSVSTDKRYWKKAIDAFYEKYSGIYQWHQGLIREVADTGIIQMATGRVYKYEYKTNFRGELELPVTQIKNYPVQGLGADIVCMLRVDFFQRFVADNLPGLYINTVHDSIVLDVPNDQKVIDKTCELFYNVLSSFPQKFEQMFGVKFDLDIGCEIEVGHNQYEMEKYKC